MNFACYYSPRGILSPVLVAVVKDPEALDLFWNIHRPMELYPHGIYIIERTKEMPHEPENLNNSDGHPVSVATLETEYALLREQGETNPNGWVARRMAAIRKFLGRTPSGTLPEDHPRKIPNRRLP